MKHRFAKNKLLQRHGTDFADTNDGYLQAANIPRHKKPKHLTRHKKQPKNLNAITHRGLKRGNVRNSICNIYSF